MRKLKILVVDFDEESRLALSEYLKSEGFEISTAGDGEAGLEKCKGEYPDLVIVEPMISKLHGFELCSIISHDFNGQIPVVILTKFYREEQFKIEAMSAYGASAFLSKPFKGPEILSTVNDLLKDKIKEFEEKEMAEEPQNLEEFSEEALDNIKVEAKVAEVELQADELDSEFLEVAPTEKSIQGKEEKSPDIKTEVEKMLADTLSEFGLNLGKTGVPQTEEQNLAPPEEKINNATQEEAVATEVDDTVKEHVEEKESVQAKDEVEEIKVEAKEANVDLEDELKSEEVKAEENFDSPKKAKRKEAKKQAVLTSTEGGETKETKEETDVDRQDKTKSIFREEGEEKSKISPVTVLKNSIGYLKKLPLKFIVPFILVAAVALSASFIFRKPKSTDSSPQNRTAAIQPVKKSVDAEPEEVLIDDPEEGKKSQGPSPTQKSSTQPPAERLKEESTQVKTKVNELLPVNDLSTQAPDVESVNLEEAVLTEPTDHSSQPLLTQELVSSPLQEDQESPNTSSEDLSDQINPFGDQSATQEDKRPEETSQTENEIPSVETGDLIPLEDVDIEPEISKRVDPSYPSVAFQRGVEGKVVINVLISESGDVIETALIKGISGPYGFNEDCTSAVQQWKFVPAFKNGVKVKVWKTISFTFKKS
jgi:TonB family protein